MRTTIWKLTLAYDGTEFHGWQVQPQPSATPTIQGILAEAIAAVTGERVLPQGSGRTDAGVHASAQVVSFPLTAPIPPLNLQHALNRILPAAIQVLASEHAPADFHARHSAVGKIYCYRIFHGPVCSPFLARYVTNSRWPLDLAAMQEAAQTILGEHDFTSFAATDPDRTTRLKKQGASTSSVDRSRADASVDLDEVLSEEVNPAIYSNVRRIDQSDWSWARFPPMSANELEESGIAAELSPFSPGWAGRDCKSPGDNAGVNSTAEMFTYTVRGNGFLHHMVRNLVGTFMEIGRGRFPPTAIQNILNGRNRASAGPTAPARGLCLTEVFY